MTAPDLEEHDFSLLHAQSARSNMRSRADLVLKSGGAALLVGAGVGLAAFGLSYLVEPKIITTERVVVQKEIEKVEIPKIVEKETVKIVEVPKVIDRPVPAAPPQPLPKTDFKKTKMYSSANKCKGVLVSHIRGEMKFENGTSCFDAYPDGTKDTRLTTSRNNGDDVVCNDTGNLFENGSPEWRCYALHNGKVEPVADYRTASSNARNAPPVDPFIELFQ